jgi:hypothetical protein
VWRRRAVDWARANPILLAAIVVGLIARIVFWAQTDRILDDALITVKHAKNVADGVGLTHHLGEGGPVHGFTSALSVLIPLPGELVAAGGGLLLLRLASLAAFVVAVVFAHRIAQRLEFGPWPTAFVLAYLVLDQSQVFFGMAGMETQVATAVLLAGVYYVLVEDFARSGVLLALALLARPDFVIWVVPALAFLIWRNRDRAVNTLLICAAILLPWLIFATAYYGTPIPNTIVAKSQAFGPTFPGVTDLGGWFDFGWNTLKAHKDEITNLTPFLERNPVSTPFPELALRLVGWTVAALAVVGAFATWRRPGFRPAIVFVVLWIAYKFVFLTVGYFEWYGVPVIAVIFLLAGAGLQRLAQARPRLVAVPALVLALAFAVHIPFTYPIEARIQHQIEDPVRDQVGRYLGEVTELGDTIATEPSGYVGYYTNATLYDYPGLTSTTVVDALSETPKFGQGGSTLSIVLELNPDWLVFRPFEWEALQADYPQVARRYSLEREFKVVESETPLEQWGLKVLNYDRDFLVLHRTSTG